MRGHPFALVEDFDGLVGRPDGHLLAGQSVGDAVEMMVAGDVIVNVDPGLFTAQIRKVFPEAGTGPVDPVQQTIPAGIAPDASSPAG